LVYSYLQKNNMTALQNIIKEAKILREKYPKKYSKWTDYVKAASKNYAAKNIDKKVKPKNKKISGYIKTQKTGNLTNVIYSKIEKKKATPKKTIPKKVAIKKVTVKKQGVLFGIKKLHKDTKSHNVNIRVISGFQKKIGQLFDTTVIKDIDSLKKQYFKLAKKYHPDAGGSTAQFQDLQKEYDKLFKALLSGSDLNSDQKNNEIVIDEAIRSIIDQIINLEGISIELMGKWLWVGDSNTLYSFSTPMYNALKSAGLTYIKKAGRPYMVYKGVESSSRGKMSKEDIAKKYGVTKFESKGTKKIGSMPKVNYIKLKSQLAKLTKAINKRPI